MRLVATIALLLVACVHLPPLVGVLGVPRLEALYGIDVAGPELEILMRHRAVLFGLLGGYQLFAVFRPAHRTAAFVAGFVSLAAFLALAWSVGGYGSTLARVVMIDVVALGVCAIGLAAQVAEDRRYAN
jgi:hypothetical protein